MFIGAHEHWRGLTRLFLENPFLFYVTICLFLIHSLIDLWMSMSVCSFFVSFFLSRSDTCILCKIKKVEKSTKKESDSFYGTRDTCFSRSLFFSLSLSVASCYHGKIFAIFSFVVIFFSFSGSSYSIVGGHWLKSWIIRFRNALSCSDFDSLHRFFSSLKEKTEALAVLF